VNAIKVAENTREISERAIKVAEETCKMQNVLEEVMKMRADIKQMPREDREHSAEQLRRIEMEIQGLEQIEASIREKLKNSHGHSSAAAEDSGNAAWT